MTTIRQAYEKESYLWEVAELTKKAPALLPDERCHCCLLGLQFCLCSLIIFINPGTLAQIAVAFIICFGFFVTEVQLKPYVEDLYDTFSFMSTISTLITLFSGLVLKGMQSMGDEEEGADVYSDTAIPVLLAVCNYGMISTFFVMLYLGGSSFDQDSNWASKVQSRFGDRLQVVTVTALMENTDVVATVLAELRERAESSEDFPERLVRLLVAIEEDFASETTTSRYSGPMGKKLLYDHLRAAYTKATTHEIVMAILNIAAGFSGHNVAVELVHVSLDLLEAFAVCEEEQVEESELDGCCYRSSGSERTLDDLDLALLRVCCDIMVNAMELVIHSEEVVHKVGLIFTEPQHAREHMQALALSLCPQDSLGQMIQQLVATLKHHLEASGVPAGAIMALKAIAEDPDVAASIDAIMSLLGTLHQAMSNNHSKNPESKSTIGDRLILLAFQMLGERIYPALIEAALPPSAVAGAEYAGGAMKLVTALKEHADAHEGGSGNLLQNLVFEEASFIDSLWKLAVSTLGEPYVIEVTSPLCVRTGELLSEHLQTIGMAEQYAELCHDLAQHACMYLIVNGVSTFFADVSDIAATIDPNDCIEKLANLEKQMVGKVMEAKANISNPNPNPGLNPNPNPNSNFGGHACKHWLCQHSSGGPKRLQA